MNGRRLIVYLFLNAIVSAAVTLTVLWVWDRTHPAPQGAIERAGLPALLRPQ